MGDKDVARRHSGAVYRLPFKQYSDRLRSARHYFRQPCDASRRAWHLRPAEVEMVCTCLPDTRQYDYRAVYSDLRLRSADRGMDPDSVPRFLLSDRGRGGSDLLRDSGNDAVDGAAEIRRPHLCKNKAVKNMPPARDDLQGDFYIYPNIVSKYSFT